MASSSRKLTVTEQQKLLASFYDEIYQGERNFGDGENLPAFADEGEPEDGDEDYQDDINDEGDDPGAEDDDPNRDEDAEIWLQEKCH